MNMLHTLIVPDDFDEMFVKIGRLACEEHYDAGGPTVDAWMRQRGKKRLLESRAAYVREHHAKRITRKDMGKILAKAMPVRDHRFVNPNTARHAAQFLRINRNGGFIVSQTSDGDWRVGTKRVSPAQLVDMAKQKGFAE